MASTFSLFNAQRWTIGWDTASPVEKSKAELEVEMLRQVARCLTEASVSKDGEIANLNDALKKLQLKLKVQERDIREYTDHLTKQREKIMLLEVRERETREYTDHLAKQGQVIEKQREEIMLLVATAKKTKESQTESVEEVRKKTVWQGQDACCQTTTEGCTSMGVQEMAFQIEFEEKEEESFVEADPEEVRDDACFQAVVLTVQEMACKTEPDSNPNTTLVGHEAGSQTQADTIIRAAATPSRKEKAIQIDVEHICKASVQSVTCQSACLGLNTSQAPLGLTAVQPGLADADKMVIIKMDLHIMRKMQLVKAERLAGLYGRVPYAAEPCFAGGSDMYCPLLLLRLLQADDAKEYRTQAWLSFNRDDMYCPLLLTLSSPMLLLFACRLRSTAC
eukprot:gene29567-5917_t